MTYSFDPATAGVGTHTITYNYTDGNGCSNSASDAVQVFALPVVTFTALADLCVDAGVQSGLGGALPVGGVYSGAGVTTILHIQLEYQDVRILRWMLLKYLHCQ